DPLLDAHFGELFGVQGGQFPAGLVQGVQFLLVLDLGGHVAAEADELGDFAVQVADRGDVEFDVAVIAAVEGGSNGFAGQGGVEGTVIRAEDLGGTERLVETAAAGGSPAPFLEGGVGPDDAEVGVDQGHPVGQGFQDVLGLEQVGGPLPGAGVV